ncbi:MAG: hypothetical protein H8E40_16440, partial [Chloroflexi bacterium]|nr:hypothetical protein [Chloroflexota bacterium]
QVPVHTRRMGRGAVPEDHRLAVTAGQRQPLPDNADVVLLLGLHASYLEEWFEPPIWNDKAKYIQIHEAPEAFFITPPTEIAIAGNPKLVLKQMIDCAKDLKRETSKWASWLQFMDETKQRVDKGLKDRLEQWRERKPIHPELLAQEILDIMDDDATIVPDSLSLSGMVTGRIKAKFAGQILDAGLHQSVGHGPGIACGAQLARPGKQVILLLGDGGMGVGGMDIETLRRYNLPVIIIQYTNSAWAGRSVSRELFWWKSDPWNMVPGIRYDKMFDAVGCHGEHVEDPKEIRPALERALNSGITSVVNVVGETHAAHPLTRRMAMRSIWSLGNVDELPDEGKAEMQRLSPREVGRIQKILLDYGLEVPLEELMQITGRSIEEAKGEKK